MPPLSDSQTLIFPPHTDTLTPTLSQLTAQYRLSASPKLFSRTLAMRENCCPHRTDARVVLKEINSMLPLLARIAALLYVKGRREVE